MLNEQIMRGAGPIVDPAVLDVIRRLPFAEFFTDADPRSLDPGILPAYLERFTAWIGESRMNRVTGLAAFPHRKLTAGITQSFDDFFFRHRNRRIRICRGEYPYAKRVAVTWEFVDELEQGDALVISAPFSGTGAMHERFDELLRQANELKVPVLIDCAFFGICRNLMLHANEPCVESVCFSLSKVFASGAFRSGIEFCRHREGAAAAQNEWCYVQLLPAKIGLELMDRFSPDYIVSKYRPIQEQVCSELQIDPTDTVILGIGGKGYEAYAIDEVVNRCCISPAIQAVITATGSRA